jgi:hypothetical protein
MSAGLRRWTDEDGAIGGLEVLPFGLLVFVAGMLLVVNAWAVVDAKLTAEAAAREGARAFVEAPDAASAPGLARTAAEESVAGVGRDPQRLELDLGSSRLVRCAEVTVETAYEVPALTLPFVGGFGSGITVRGRHRELVDAFRAGLGEEQVCG